ncbi:MAG TPA: DUF423 domain-containing protein [Nitrospiraceae bacterium]|jgi:uncharacterized membrane protein YgdD (TMEM256/DUF423 family)|nr:DUF423 domain-containing protein [Nitrospiraceae bacterium]
MLEMKARRFLIIGCVFAFTGVAAGAFGAHMLKRTLDPGMLAVYDTAARYQMYHAFGLFVVAWAVNRSPNGRFAAAGWLFAAGIVLFSGSLYAVSLMGITWLGALTPLGGVAFLAGWGVLAWQAWKTR